VNGIFLKSGVAPNRFESPCAVIIGIGGNVRCFLRIHFTRDAHCCRPVGIPSHAQPPCSSQESPDSSHAAARFISYRTRINARLCLSLPFKNIAGIFAARLPHSLVREAEAWLRIRFVRRSFSYDKKRLREAPTARGALAIRLGSR
jgi:hypothetical protein